MKKVQKLILKMLSPHNLYIENLSEEENKLLKKGIEWYGHFIANIKIVFSNTLEAPAACFVDKKKLKPIIYLNEEKFNKYKSHEQIAILKHEVLHILNEHFVRREDRNHNLWNIGTDIAINQLIPFIPEDGLHLEKINEQMQLDMEKDMPAEYYYNYLLKKYNECKNNGSGNNINNNGSSNNNSNNNSKNNSEQNQNNGGGNKQDQENGRKQNTSGDSGNCETCDKIRKFVESAATLDDHSMWENISPSQREMIKRNLEELIKEATNKARGNVPAEIEAVIELMKEKNKISWKKYLRKLLSNKKGNKIKTIKRRDRRFPKRLDLKGTKKHFTGDILVIVDVSGSMSEEEIKKGLNEVIYIIKSMQYKIHLIQVDTEPRYYPEGEKDLKNLKFNRMGSGGTFLFPAIKLADELKLPYAGIIIITDGYIESISEWDYVPKKPIYFLLTEESTSGFRSFFGDAVEQEHKNIKVFDLLEKKEY